MASVPKLVTTIDACEAKRRFSYLLDRAERGEAVVITRHGRAIAQLVPTNSKRDPARVARAIEGLRELRKRTDIGRLTIRDLINEGRR